MYSIYEMVALWLVSLGMFFSVGVYVGRTYKRKSPVRRQPEHGQRDLYIGSITEMEGKSNG